MFFCPGCEWAMEGWSKGDDCRAPHVHRIVNPLGTVVSGTSSTSPSPPSVEDSHILSNEDEALFRPVVRAPRSLPAPTAPPTKPLSSRTLLPAQQISAANSQSANVEVASAASLTDHVVIPAKLSFKFPEPSFNECAELDFEVDIQDSLPPPVEKPLASKKSSVENASMNTSESKKRVNKKQKEEKSKQSLSAINISKGEPIVSNNKKPNSFSTKLTSSSDSFDHDFLKAVDEIQFCNDELVENLETAQKTHISKREMAVGKLNCKAFVSKTKTFKDEPNPKILQDMSSSKLQNVESDICGKEKSDCSTLIDALSDTDNSDYIQGREVLKDKDVNRVIDIPGYSNDSPWEVLSEVKKEKAESVNESVISGVEDSIDNNSCNTTDEAKPKVKKSKKTKPKFRTVFKASSPIRSTVFDSNVEDIVEPKESSPSPVVSWSNIASGSVKKSVTDSVESDSNLSKDSTIYNENNIIVALCDAPQVTELCFVDEHHSFFQEPPPLEPIDLILDDEKLEVMKDSFLDYQSSSKNDDDTNEDLLQTSVQVHSVVSEKNPLSEENMKNSKVIESEECDETILQISDELVKDSYKIRKSIVMEKSSDEENVSPSESDDGTQMVALEEKQSPDSLLISLTPPAAIKSNNNKKKSKRKRR